MTAWLIILTVLVVIGMYDIHIVSRNSDDNLRKINELESKVDELQSDLNNIEP